MIKNLNPQVQLWLHSLFLGAMISLFTGCGHFTNFNAVEGRIGYDEHYATINNVDYRSGEQEFYGVGITNRPESKSQGKLQFDYSFYPDVAFERSKLVPTHDTDKINNHPFTMNRISAFTSLRGIAHTIVGMFEISAGVGASYFEAYNDQFDTSRIEPTFRYQGTYSIFILNHLFASVSFVFQESPQSTYSEYYSLVYKLGLTF